MRKDGSSMVVNIREVLLKHLRDDYFMLTYARENKNSLEKFLANKFVYDLSLYCHACGMKYESMTDEDICSILELTETDTIVSLLRDQYVSEGIMSLDPGISLGDVAKYYSSSNIDNLLRDAEGNFNGAMNHPMTGNREIDSMVNPSHIITSMQSSTTLSTTQGKDKCMQLFVQTYMKAAHKFSGMSQDKAQGLVQYLIQSNDSNLFSIGAKSNMEISYNERITIAEALLWTSIFVSSGISQDVVLAWAAVTDEDIDAVKYTNVNPSEWNCIIVAPFKDKNYLIYSGLNGENRKAVPIVAVSQDTYKVGVQSTKGK